MFNELFRKVSEAPTHPGSTPQRPQFDVASLYEGPVRQDTAVTGPTAPLDEKLRQAYFWITNNAIISPFYDIEYNDSPPQQYTLGDQKVNLTLPTDQSLSLIHI